MTKNPISAIGALCAALVMLGHAAPAPAAPTLVTASFTLAGTWASLALDGPATLVGTQQSRYTSVVRAFISGQPPRTVAVIKLPDEHPSISFAASTSRIAALGRGYTPGKYGSSESEILESGPVGGPLSTLTAGCMITPTLDETVSNAEGQFQQHNVVAAEAELVAYDSFGCMVIHDFASGLQRTITLAATLNPVERGVILDLPPQALMSLAGRLIAYRVNPLGGEGPASVVVYNIDTNNTLYAVPLPTGLGTMRDETAPTFGLEPDGRLVIADPTSCTAVVTTVADPTPRPLGAPACSVRRVYDGRALIVAPGPGGKRDLEWTSIVAPQPHLIAALGKTGILALGPMDLNQTDVAYALSGCYPRIYRTPLSEPGAPPALPAHCPIVHVNGSATLTRKHLQVRLSCPLGCTGSFTAWIGTESQRRAHRDGAFIGHDNETDEPAATSYSLPPGQAKTFTLLPSGEYEEHPSVRSLTRLLRHHHEHLVLYCRTEAPNVAGVSREEAQQLHLQTETPSVIDLAIKFAHPHRP
jgi:hypothetical protein